MRHFLQCVIPDTNPSPEYDLLVARSDLYSVEILEVYNYRAVASYTIGSIVAATTPNYAFDTRLRGAADRTSNLTIGRKYNVGMFV